MPDTTFSVSGRNRIEPDSELSVSGRNRISGRIPDIRPIRPDTGYPAGYCYNYEISQTRLNKLYLAKIIIASIHVKLTLDLLENKRFS